MDHSSGKQYYAHTRPDRPPAEWEPLEEHLVNVATLARQFADEFNAGDWGYLAGLWHDLGKYSAEFQAYLRSSNGLNAHLEQLVGKVDHATAGAQHAVQVMPKLGELLAYCIAGHHSGLLDRNASQGAADLANRLKKKVPNWKSAPPDLLSSKELPVPKLSIESQDATRAAFQIALFGRMLFSCLVDADFLATERFMSPQKATERPVHHLPLESLSECLGRYLAELNANCATGVVNEVRHEVLQNCRDAANLPPGLFSLTVPTGGGKTLSSLVFALSHAQLHNLRRIVVAIPFTSIIEQTADVYRNVFVPLGSDVILEHHSNLDPERETPQSRLAAENWDAPIVVTTNVQLFESLFAAKTSRCRKLHNLVGSVIILDEAQTLPVEFLRPCLAALRELAVDYRCSIVLCTATQPALDWREQFPVGLKGIREIIPRPQVIAERMRRVQAAYLGDRTDEQLVDGMSSHASFLAIVNTRPHAARLYKLLIATGSDPAHTFHLSTNLCGSHRAKIITEIRQRLASGQSCRVISTQLIEAGVDVDFPVVYRAVSGVDSIAQAAGRCNREGRLTCGTVYIFNPADVRLIGYLRSTAETTKELLPDFADLLDSAAIRRYFELHYWKQAGDNHWDGHRIMECFPTPPGKLHFQYKTAADAFRLIDNVGKPVLVPYGKGEKLIEQLRKIGPHRDLLRKLQRYTVNVFEQVYNSMLGRDIELLDSGFAVLINSTCYDKVLGFCADRAGDHDPQDLVI